MNQDAGTAIRCTQFDETVKNLPRCFEAKVLGVEICRFLYVAGVDDDGSEGRIHTLWFIFSN